MGGITVDPIVPEALRMRRFYVRPAFRRTGIGREIGLALLEGPLQMVTGVRVRHRWARHEDLDRWPIEGARERGDCEASCHGCQVSSR
jgi:GNAT superfamily N-acetyltransferase